MAVSAKAQTLQTTFNSNGLATMIYNGVTLYAPYATPQKGDVPYVTDPSGQISQNWNSSTKTLTWVYSWGNVACKYVPLSDRLNLEIKVTNTSAAAISGVKVFPLRIDFPQIPVGFDAYTPQVNYNSDGPTVRTANFGTGNLTVVNQDVTKQLVVGFLTTNDTPTFKRYNIYVGSKAQWGNPSDGWPNNENWPVFNRTIPASGSDTYKVSLRFSPSGADTYAVASDIYSAYAAANPSQMNWSDRRPIGALVLADPPSSSQSNPANNPRGWNLKDSIGVDITTSASIQDFRTRVLAYADRSIAILQDRDAQGMITWDIEGEEYPHATSYIGDPRLVTNLGAEMNGIADAYFKKFTDAGLRVGICIRPQQLKNSNGSSITPTTIKSTVSTPYQEDVANISQQLLAKIDYAKNRWGCTLFYIDSNTGARDVADVAALKIVSAARPDVLLMPEHESFKYYAYSAPFSDLSGTSANGIFPGTPEEVRRTYPNAFSTIKIDNDPAKVDALRPQIVEAVRKGDVLIFNAWYNSTESQQVKSIYAEANSLRVTTTQDVVANDGLTSLREAITYANSHPGYDTITFAQSAWGTIKLNGTALPTVTESCFITGPGGDAVIIDGDAKSRILKINTGAAVTVNGLFFTNGNASGSDNTGGAFLNNGNLTVSFCSVKNSSGFYGGGIFNNGTLSLTESLLSGNTAIDSGGGLANLGAVTAGNCTFSGNTTSANTGTGGAGINSYGGSASINLNFCTLTGNNGANAASSLRAGIWMEADSKLSIANTIVYGNSTRDVQNDAGSVLSSGYNIVGNKGSTNGFLSTDKIGVNPLLGPLQNNGGPTYTHAFSSGSPAINAADPNNTAPNSSDQRGGGYPRVLSGRADIGALESNFTSASTGSS